jgi:hypothetical protein
MWPFHIQLCGIFLKISKKPKPIALLYNRYSMCKVYLHRFSLVSPIFWCKRLRGDWKTLNDRKQHESQLVVVIRQIFLKTLKRKIKEMIESKVIPNCIFGKNQVGPLISIFESINVTLVCDDDTQIKAHNMWGAVISEMMYLMNILQRPQFS